MGCFLQLQEANKVEVHWRRILNMYYNSILEYGLSRLSLQLQLRSYQELISQSQLNLYNR